MLARTGIWKISYASCGFSSIKVDYSDYPKRLISRINEVCVFSKKNIALKEHKLHLSRLFCCNHTCYCVNMVFLTSHYITLVSRYHPRYQSRSLMYIHGLISRNSAELAEAVPVGMYCSIAKIVSEYGQQKTQSQTADNPMAPRGRATQPSRDTRKTNKAKQLALSSQSR